MNNRERMLSLLETEGRWPFVPAAFFLHFPADCHRGQAAVDKHLEFFRHTGMDWSRSSSSTPFLTGPRSRPPRTGQRCRSMGATTTRTAGVVEGLVQAAKDEALVVVDPLLALYERRAHYQRATITRRTCKRPRKRCARGWR